MVRGLTFWIKIEEGFCPINVAKTKALIRCAVTAQLICAFVFAYAKDRFSHDAAHIFMLHLTCFLFSSTIGRFGA